MASNSNPDQKSLGERFFALHHRDHPFVIPNPWDAGSAKILAALGYEALATTSVGLDHTNGHRSATSGRDQILANAKLIAGATDLPVSIDLEDCYGADAAGIAETIELAAATGAVGGSIEDVRYGSDGEMYGFDAAVARVESAVEAARALPFKFTLTARCENFLFGRPELDDTIARLQAYSAAGADVLYAPGLTSLAEIEAVVNAVDKPVNVLLGLANTTLTMADMHRAGVARVSLGSGLHRAATTAFVRAAQEIRESGTFGFTAGVLGMDAIDEMMD